LLNELEIPFSTLILYCDNLSTVALSHNLVLHAKTKHMDLIPEYIFPKGESAQQESCMVQHIPATHHYADLLTKLLSPKIATNSVESTIVGGLSI